MSFKHHTAALAVGSALLLGTVGTVAVPAADARACVSKGLVIRHREGVTCDRAKRVLTRYRQTARPVGRWDCTTHWTWQGRGYCETQDESSYFDFRRA